MAPPSVRAVGTVASGTTSPRSVGMPAGTAEGDAIIIIGEHNSATPMSASGYTELAYVSNQGGLTGGTALTVLGKIAGAGEGNASVTVDTNHNTCRAIAIRDHGLSAITDIVVGADNTGAVATGVALGITVEVDSLVLICASTTRDANSTAHYSGFNANSNLTSTAEQMDNVITTGSGGGIGMGSGVATVAAIGNSNFTNATAENWCAVQIGIKPIAEAPENPPPLLVMAPRRAP